MDPAILNMGVPVLGICYGMQLACKHLGCSITPAHHREFGRANLEIIDDGGFFKAIPQRSTVWMSHGDQVGNIDQSFDTLASTPTCTARRGQARLPPLLGRAVPPGGHPHAPRPGHPPELHLRDLRLQIHWRMADFLQTERERIRETVGNERVICGLSGGVDSSVLAALLHTAIGDQLTCVFVDNGLLRKKERDLVETTFRDHFDIDLRVNDATEHFMSDLAGISDPQEKRRLIGHRFIEVFKHEAEQVKGAAFLAQGTLYPDVIESGHGHAGQSANIKLHHNVGGLPEELGFKLVEPLRDLFKDEVRKLGEVLGLPEQVVWRHPFPGPGLAVRVLGEITKESSTSCASATRSFWRRSSPPTSTAQTSQVFAVLLPVQSPWA